MSRLSPADLLALGSLGMRTRRLRAALSALGIALGIATVVVVTGIPASSQQALLDELTALGTNLLRAQPTPRQDDPVLLPESSVAMVQRIGPVTAAAAVANTHTRVRRNDLLDPGHSSDITVLAATPGLLDTVNGHVQSGEFLSRPDFPGVALGHVAAQRLGIPDAGDRPAIFVGERWFTVTGVLGPMPLAPDVERSVLVGWDAARTHLGFDGHPTVVYVKAREESMEDVRAILPATLHGEIPGLVQVSRPSDALAAKRATQNSYSALFLGLAGVALLVGGVGVANTMVISVLERRSEIGLRRALGATRGHIRAQFLTEAVLLSGLGGLAGTALGALGVAGYATLHRWPLVIPLEVLAAGVLAAFVVGAAAGLYPSIRASRLTPTQALAA
ncbi:ABC transporter permease [Lentzea flaviverrucosa]|uniref:Putative ABC transport system permease protein n=1 Tax=Lentzea flaviverrucosa TaxID=200379 RepID=A0A1H9AE21_9PSEU|nr:ABC transporter permease [Lentzea flaviverrucosa]RDI32091.1 putative ABC transport system permease protein [Lentzea flaviverrucosa]SEP74835.1 putative ABC transport system permease protein [Lentzea flaviverrucosa]